MIASGARLSRTSLASLPRSVLLPGYQREAHGIGIVHLGVGAFHRAHQAVYADEVLSRRGGDWSIAGVSLHSATARDELQPQDGLYTLVEADGERESCRVIGSLREVLVAPESPGRVLDLLARPAVHVVTLTVTEKGYCLDPASGALDLARADIRRDLATPDSPVTTIGYLAAAIRRRAAADRPLSIVCCDNLPGNGARLRNAVHAFLEASAPAARDWCARRVSFPSTMVDRIVPAVTESTREAVAAVLGVRDEACVRTEPFAQWIVEDCFAGPRPEWEIAGARLARDVAPYEQMKLTLLNGAHSAIAYLGSLAGHAFVHEAMRDPLFAAFVETLMERELAPEVQPPPGFDLGEYARQLRARFANAALGHRIAQIAMDGSQKLPQRWLPVLRRRLAAGRALPCLATALAAWMRYVGGNGTAGSAPVIDDPLALRLAAATAGVHDPQGLCRALLGVGEIFGGDLAQNDALAAAVVRAIRTLDEGGVHAALRACLQESTESAA